MNEDAAKSQVAKASFLALREELARVLGIQTVDLLIDRGVAEIGEAYPPIRTISVQAGELRLDSVDEAFRDSTAEETKAALHALTAVMLLIVARLLGRRVAESIAQNIDKANLLRTVRI